MQTTPLITPGELRTALGANTYDAIFDDSNQGSVPDTSAAVQQVLSRAHARVVSRLGVMYRQIPDGTDNEISQLLKDAELGYAEALAYERHPEYVRQYGEADKVLAKMKRADSTMQLLQEAVLRIVDVPPEPKPRNVGGIVVDDQQRVFLTGSDGTRNSGDF